MGVCVNKSCWKEKGKEKGNKKKDPTKAWNRDGIVVGQYDPHNNCIKDKVGDIINLTNVL